MAGNTDKYERYDLQESTVGKIYEHGEADVILD